MFSSRQEYWTGLPCPPPGDLPNPGIKPVSLMSPASRFFFVVFFFFTTSTTLGLPWWHSGKESPCQCRRLRRCGLDPWSGKIPWSKKCQPTPVFLPGKFHGQRSLEGHSPWGPKELATTEQLSNNKNGAGPRGPSRDRPLSPLKGLDNSI